MRKDASLSTRLRHFDVPKCKKIPVLGPEINKRECRISKPLVIISGDYQIKCSLQISWSNVKVKWYHFIIVRYNCFSDQHLKMQWLFGNSVDPNYHTLSISIRGTWLQSPVGVNEAFLISPSCAYYTCSLIQHSNNILAQIDNDVMLQFSTNLIINIYARL